MQHPELNIVTGATGYTGKYIARRLLSMGRQVKSLTGHPHRHNPFGEQVPALPFNFENPRALVEGLRGATTLYNTYWVRFSRGNITFEAAVQNTRILLHAATAAGIGRFIHISIANPDPRSPLPYYRGKALVERAVLESGLSYAIIRPTVIFGTEDILINNIAWLLRRFPIFAIAGPGDYTIQPVFVEDVAELAVAAAERRENVILDAAGPEVFAFKELVQLIARTVNSRARALHVPPGLALLLSRLVGYIIRDVVLTREELEGLMANLLVSSGPPIGRTRFSQWLERHAATLGTCYASELKRHYQ
ncbi:MAG: NAD(P)H-binding protein [Deltaproteobacteria bacterium]|nr:NAD(P)H-binding protein [Deltaproteobacteria bacterium]